MKRISKSFLKMFKKMASFFDKWLITPITKFFVSVYDFFCNNGSGFEKVLVNRQSLVIISLIFALLAFYSIDQKHTTLIDNSAEILYNQEVKPNFNEELYVVEGIPETVDVTLVGRRWDVYLAKQYPMNGVTLDLTGYTPGSHSVKFKYEQAVSSVEYKIDPSSINVTIYDKVSATKELSTDVIHKENLDTKLNIDGIVLERDNVIIKGAAHQLDKVAIVKAIVDVNSLSSVKVGSTKLTDIPLIAYDSNGEKVDVEIVPSSIDATIKIASPTKEIPIKLIADGTLDGKAIKSLTSNVTSVTVYGTSEAIEKIEFLPIKVDVNGISEDKTYNINIVKPTGIREVSVKNISVELVLDNIVSKDAEGVRINIENISSGYRAQAIGEQYSTVSVIVNGSKEVIDKLDTSSISAYVDLEGLGVGEHTVPVKVTGEDSRLTYVPRVKEIKIKITKK